MLNDPVTSSAEAAGPPAAVRVDTVSFQYGDRLAVDSLDLTVQPGEMFALLGPNGSGKTTLFRLLSTLIPLQTGEIMLMGRSMRSDTMAVRGLIGVVFQAASLDRQLTVSENLHHQGKLYGLPGRQIHSRVDELLTRLGLTDRRRDLVANLSGGLRRRVELAKGLMHLPRLLLLDEPTTGLDPGARAEFWRYLRELRMDHGLTVVWTTHLLEEADRADRLAILDQGRRVAIDTPEALRRSVGGDAITIACDDAPRVAAMLREEFECDATVVEGTVRLEQPDGHTWIPRLAEALGKGVQSITLGKPTLEDVFVARTGHAFDVDEASPPAEPSSRKRGT